MEDSSDAIVEERIELVASPGSKNLQLKMAHFIKPSIGLGSIDETQVGCIPRHCLSSLPTNFEPQKWPLRVRFLGWRSPTDSWKTWVVKMASLHESTWRKAGIFEAIMSSTYMIRRNKDLLFGVSEKWCHETKSFIFSWGEATITLEDVMILGGFPVLGFPVFHPVETEETMEISEKLDNARKEIIKSASNKASQSLWMKKFMHSDSTVEHEAFLAMWLSRFVIPSSFDIVTKSVIPIAIHLARGTRIALAPAVLAKIYGDLHLLKRIIVASAQLESKCKCDDENVVLALNLLSPLSLVQVWVWERFLDLKPKPNLIKKGEPRLAMWHDVKCEVHDVRSVLDSAMGGFDWRPYVRKITNFDAAKYYADEAKWISIDSSSDDELLSYARCLKATELVGLDCIEQYLPHRVALQFGMDQDIPGCVSRSVYSYEIPWTSHCKSVCGGKLYIPSRAFEAGFTDRYLEWWKQSVLDLQQTSNDALEDHGSFTNLKTMPKRGDKSTKSNEFMGFKMIPKGLKRRKKVDSCIGFSGFNIKPKKSEGEKKGIFTSTLPGFYAKSLKRSRQFLKQQKKVNKANSDLGSPLKRSVELARYPKTKMTVCAAGFTAQSSQAKGIKSSNGIALGSEAYDQVKKENTFESSLYKPFKVLPLKLILQKELNDSPFPPGFPPKEPVAQAKDSVKKGRVTPLDFQGFPPICINEAEVTPPVPPGFPPKPIGKDKVIGRKISRSASRHECMKNENNDDPMDSDSEQQTIADNAACRYAGEGENSLGLCQGSSSSNVDFERPEFGVLPTILVEKVLPTEAASEGSKRATIQETVESNARRTLGSNDSPDDKASKINDIEEHYPEEISIPNLDARIGRLERLVAEIKEARRVKSMVSQKLNQNSN